VIHNQYFGWGSRLRVFGYPSADEEWMVVGGGKQRVEREFDGRFAAGETRSGELSWSIEAIYDRSGTPRFFGIGNYSVRSDETSYINNQGLIDVFAGRNFTQNIQLAYEARVRYVEVLPGTLKGLPAIGSLYPAVEGLGAEHVVQQTALVTYDTRDSPIMPRSGARYIIYDGFVSRALGSTVSYTYFGAEARRYFPLGRDVTLAWHAAARYMPSAGDAPFWAMSSLGGDRSITNEREPLRGYGFDRYIDRNLFATGAELRVRVAGFNAFRTHVSLELAPFVDAGKVFPTMGASPFTHMHVAGGLGVRGVASPFVVGYVDIGFARSKPAVFSGLNYPF
jgi:outer membrane protein assembly factor BamA